MPAGGVVTGFLPSDARFWSCWALGEGGRSKVIGQEVAVKPFLLLMCSSVTLATTEREVVLLKPDTRREGVKSLT